jgi:predicted Fe-S protein YdhL (DUF1289 family)
MNECTPEPVASPCRDICRLDVAGICMGCGRSLGEIEEWSRAGRERRLQICAAARERIGPDLESSERGKLLDRNPR